MKWPLTELTCIVPCVNCNLQYNITSTFCGGAAAVPTIHKKLIIALLVTIILEKEIVITNRHHKLKHVTNCYNVIYVFFLIKHTSV